MKKIIIIITILLAILTGYFYFYFISPIFIGTRNANKTPYCNWSNHKCNPIRNTDFSSGDNEILIYLDKDCQSSLPAAGLAPISFHSCTDNRIIQQVKEHFEFYWNEETYTETTHGHSAIYFLKEGEVVFCTPFSVSDYTINIFLSETGWITAVNYNFLKVHFSSFKFKLCPIVRVPKIEAISEKIMQ